MNAAATISFSDLKHLLSFTVWCYRDASAPPKVQMRPCAKVNNPRVTLLEVLPFYSPGPGYPWGMVSMGHGLYMPFQSFEISCV